MNITEKDKIDISKLCVESCGGKCCDPWWGVIFYTLKSRGAGTGGPSLEREIKQSIKKRIERIRSSYVTKDKPPRMLFGEPERINVALNSSNVLPDGTLKLEIRAMFAFRCLFLGDDGLCLIHPTDLGRDIRPPHCAELGNPLAARGEKGYCRIVEAAFATPGNDDSVMDAVSFEKATSDKHYNEGVKTVAEAARKVAEEARSRLALTDLKAQGTSLMSSVGAVGKVGRNEPCPCGSGKKHKRCHGA